MAADHDTGEINRLRDHYHKMNGDLQQLYTKVGVMDARLTGLVEITAAGLARVEQLVHEGNKQAKDDHSSARAEQKILEDRMVTKQAFEPVRMIAYAVVTFSLSTVAMFLWALFSGKLTFGD